MRVWHVTDTYAPTLGGIEIHVAELARRQQAAGDQVRVVTLTPDDGSIPPGATGGVDVHRLGAPEHAGLPVLGHERLRGLTSELRRLLAEGRPDVLHVHASVVSPLAAAAVRVASADGVPALVTVHSMWEGCGPLPWLARHGLGLPHARVVWSAVSRVAADALAPVVAPSPVHVLPNAVDPAAWAGVAGAVHVAPLHLVAVMRLTRVKRAVPLAEVLAEVREIVPDDVPLRATVAGDGPARGRMEQRLGRLGADWVSLPGAADRAGIRRLLAGADVFVAPAHRESFGIAALEARASGVPVVAPACSGVTEFVSHGVDGLLGDGDHDLARQIARLCVDDALRARIRWHNLVTPIAHDWERARRGAEDLYAVARQRDAALERSR
ncbi:glycosyltransferase family 4 protein [Nocardioides acrostichi]|uniref:Glycosyltransferase family 4 protein n=1 Tax=Nocardioides acrostichi TaxID=2784339 RepID=A0A930Y6C8_9ACTN|nr:glycosyltransferase family 4 protein [Nocardioides acrostichi]MBF4160837.1 glycosyltransferase family 4 protein [Nocardioides acrostichi]